MRAVLPPLRSLLAAPQPPRSPTANRRACSFQTKTKHTQTSLQKKRGTTFGKRKLSFLSPLLFLGCADIQPSFPLDNNKIGQTIINIINTVKWNNSANAQERRAHSMTTSRRRSNKRVIGNDVNRWEKITHDDGPVW